MRLGPLSRLPAGQAAVYRDPRDGSPALQGPAVTPLPKRQVVIHDGILYAVPGPA